MCSSSSTMRRTARPDNLGSAIEELTQVSQDRSTGPSGFRIVAADSRNPDDLVLTEDNGPTRSVVSRNTGLRQKMLDLTRSRPSAGSNGHRIARLPSANCQAPTL